MKRKRYSGGCDPEVASSIVDLLMERTELGRVLEPRVPQRRDARIEDPGADKDKLTPRNRKLSPAVIALVLELRGYSVFEVRMQVKERLGVSISAGSVYKTWRFGVPSG